MLDEEIEDRPSGEIVAPDLFALAESMEAKSHKVNAEDGIDLNDGQSENVCIKVEEGALSISLGVSIPSITPEVCAEYKRKLQPIAEDFNAHSDSLPRLPVKYRAPRRWLSEDYHERWVQIAEHPISSFADAIVFVKGQSASMPHDVAFAYILFLGGKPVDYFSRKTDIVVELSPLEDDEKGAMERRRAEGSLFIHLDEASFICFIEQSVKANLLGLVPGTWVPRMSVTEGASDRYPWLVVEGPVKIPKQYRPLNGPCDKRLENYVHIRDVNECGCMMEMECSPGRASGLCRERIGKGCWLDIYPDDYTIVDLETTGFSPQHDEIIEIAAIRVRGHQIVDRFSTLVHPNRPISKVVTDITGITNEMVADADDIDTALAKFYEFVRDDTIVGHNVNFDINFLYDNFERSCQFEFSNDFVDTMRLAKGLLELEHYRLSDLCGHFGIDTQGAHRALNDCEMTHKVLNALGDLRKRIGESGFQLPRTAEKPKRKYWPSNSPDYRDVVPQIPADQIDQSNPLFGKAIVITGELPLPRSEAWQRIVNLGGILKNGVTKKTDILIVGGDLNAEHKSSKHEKALKLQADGVPIRIVGEDAFMEMILGAGTATVTRDA